MKQKHKGLLSLRITLYYMVMDKLLEIVDTPGIEGQKDKEKERTELPGSKNSF